MQRLPLVEVHLFLNEVLLGGTQPFLNSFDLQPSWQVTVPLDEMGLDQRPKEKTPNALHCCSVGELCP